MGWLANKFNHTEDQDLALIRRIAKKDRKALETLYYDYTPRIGKFLAKLLKRPELVDDVVNEVMLAVWQNAEKFDAGQAKVSTWLFAIAHKKALRLLAQQNKLVLLPDPDDELEDFDEPGLDGYTSGHGELDPGDPEAAVLGWELGDTLAWAMGQLTPEHRTVLELTCIEQLSCSEVASIMDCPLNTVKTRIFHARKKLAGLLTQRGYALKELGGYSDVK